MTTRPFHLGRVTDRNGNECEDAAFITVGSDHGQDADDCEIEITGHEAAKIAHLIAATPDMLRALQELDAILDFGADFSPCECFPAIDGLKNAARMAGEAIAKAEGRS